MPVTLAQNTPALGITVDSPWAICAPGDVITGFVYRNAPIVSPEARVVIAFHGRLKSKLVKQRGNNSRNYYRERFTLLSGHQGMQALHDGPIHIPQTGDALRWPFAITIPTRPDVPPPTSSAAWQTQLKDGAPMLLPPSMHSFDDGFASQVEAFVEYYLQAELRVSGDSKTNMYEATVPILLKQYSAEPPVVDFRMTAHSYTRNITSQRLIPGMEEADLSVSQKMKKFFGSSSVPTFWFKLQIGAPSVVQLENPEPISFKLRILPDMEKSSEIIRDVPQKVKILSVSVRIRSTTNVLFEGTFDSHRGDTSSNTDWMASARLKALGEEIFIPCADSTGEGPVIDLGPLLNLRLARPRQSGFLSNYDKLGPTYTFYNIKYMHNLEWDIRGDVVGEDFKVTGSVMLTVLPESDTRMVPSTTIVLAEPSKSVDSWIHPPAEGDAPPSFSQVEKEDGMGKKDEAFEKESYPQEKNAQGHDN